MKKFATHDDKRYLIVDQFARPAIQDKAVDYFFLLQDIRTGELIIRSYKTVKFVKEVI